MMFRRISAVPPAIVCMMESRARCRPITVATLMQIERIRPHQIEGQAIDLLDQFGVVQAQ